MNKYALENVFGIEGFNIAWYGVIIAFGVFLAVVLCIGRARKMGFRDDLVIDFILIALPVAIAGARLYYVAFEWEQYKNDLWSILATRSGGLAIYGGIIAGMLTAVLFCRYHHIPLLRFLDLAIPGLLVGQIVGRWGNFMNQEAFGKLVTNEKLQFFPYSVYIDSTKSWHQATFFYESIWNLILLLCILFIIEKHKKYDGTILATYFIGYGIGRFLIEGLRGDSLYVFGIFRVSQLVSLAMTAGGIILLLRLKYFRPSDSSKCNYLK